jgi:hypothetical protein
MSENMPIWSHPVKSGLEIHSATGKNKPFVWHQNCHKMHDVKMSDCFPGVRSRFRIIASAAFGLALSTASIHAQEPFVFSGIPIQNPRYEILVNEFGYSDSMLDRRSKFVGREYLSGEWAAAVYYQGGNLPAMTRWLTDRFVFPDFITPAPHFTSKYDPPFSNYGPNSSGFDVYGSTIINPDLEIGMKYEMLDLGMDMAGRLSLGLTAHSAGGAGSFVPSGRYVFKHTYDIRNISGLTLTDVKLYQFIHTLEGDAGVYDGRNYGGGMSSYRYGVTLQGKSFGFNQKNYETVEHTDTVAMKYSMVPSGFELGAFGVKDTDSHQFGEPPAGVHKSVAANTLSSSDAYNPAGSSWVAGAVSFNLGNLAPNATTSLDVLLAIHTTFEVVHPPINLVVRTTTTAGGNLTIDFEETTHNPLVGFLLRKSQMLDLPPLEWEPVSTPYQIDVPFPNWRRFQVPVTPETVPKLFFVIQPMIIND